MTAYMLTTVDNPFDPFDEYDSWIDYDLQLGYDSCGYLARIAKTSNALSDQENNEEISRAIDEIIKFDFMNVYKKVSKEIEDDEQE